MIYKFGKRPARTDARTLRMEKYLLATLPMAPPSYNNLARVEAKLGISDPTKLYPMDGNDQFGDCTIAALFHAETTYHGLIGVKSIASTKTVTNLYFKLTDGEDSGLAELDVLNYWRKHSVSKDKILAYVQLDPKNHEHVKTAIELFGGVYLGFQVPENCLSQFDAHQPWMGGKLTDEGHAVYAVNYDANYLTVLTWGTIQLGTWDGWWNRCVDEVYAILPPEAATVGFAPGFDLVQLKADLQAVTN